MVKRLVLLLVVIAWSDPAYAQPEKADAVKRFKQEYSAFFSEDSKEFSWDQCMKKTKSYIEKTPELEDYDKCRIWFSVAEWCSDNHADDLGNDKLSTLYYKALSHSGTIISAETILANERYMSFSPSDEIKLERTIRLCGWMSYVMSLPKSEFESRIVVPANVERKFYVERVRQMLLMIPSYTVPFFEKQVQKAKNSKKLLQETRLKFVLGAEAYRLILEQKK